MSTILELREKRNKIWNTAKAFLDSKRGVDGLVPPESAAEYDRMETEMVNLGKEIKRLERQQAFDLELGKATSEPIVSKPIVPEKPKTGRASNEYRADFKNILRGKPMLHNVMQAGVDADGGYLVPDEFERQIITGLEESNIIRSIAKVITTSAERKIPLASTHSVAQWTLENGAYQESNPTFGQITVDAYKLTDLVKVSTELLQDSMFDLETYIAREFSRAFGIAEEQAFCVGTARVSPRVSLPQTAVMLALRQARR